MIDTHAHLDDKQFDADRDDVIRRAFDSGVEKIVNIGAGLGSSERSVELAKQYENIYAAVGFHPHYFMKHGSWSVEHKNRLEELARSEKVVAIGEIGLDYHSHTEEKITEEQKIFQKEGFIFQLDLAGKLLKPVVLHCRGERAEIGKNYREENEAYEDILAIIEKYSDLKFIFHGFGGRLDFTKKILEKNNIYFSLNGNISYAKPNAEILEVIRMIPLEKIMLETDCPYLAPVPKRGERNEPSFIRHVAEKLAEIKRENIENIVEKTTENALKMLYL